VSGPRRVHEIAKELNRNSKELVEILQGLGVDAKAANSPVTPEEEARLRAHLFGIKDERPATAAVSVDDLLKPALAGARLRKKAPRETKEEPSAVETPPAETTAPTAEALPETAPAAEAASPAATAPAREPSVAPADKTASAKAGKDQATYPPAAATKAPETSTAETAAKTETPESEAARAAAKGKKPGAPRTARVDLRQRIIEEIESERGSKLTTDALRGIGNPPPAETGTRGRAPSKPVPPKHAGRSPAPASGGRSFPRRPIPDAVRGRGPKPRGPITVEPKAPPPKKKVQLRGDQTLGELAMTLDVSTEALQNHFREIDNRETTPLTLLNAVEQTAAANALGFEATGEPRVPKLEPRMPVVTVLGHVDHGKTTLLDAIRKTKVVASESGGITQHVGASIVKSKQGEIVFIDTPGHEAFTQMRARGAQVTDIVILVVATDDGVMPQTIESINHAKAAGVPIVVALTKVDKAGTDPLRVKKQLNDHGVMTEDWGGDVLAVEVAAPKNQGLDKLLEAISLQAEMMELKGDVNARTQGVVVESTLERGRGPVMTVIIQKGKLHVGDAFVVGNRAGRVRAMFDVAGKGIKEAGPSVPVEILGAEAVPLAGDNLLGMPSDKVARNLAALLVVEAKPEEAREAVFSLDEWYKQMQEGGKRELSLVVKADVAGSLEALTDQLSRLGDDEVSTKLLHGGVGVVNEGDVLLAGASQGIVIAFRVGAEPKAKQLAQRQGVEIRPYDVIYETIADVKAGLEGLLEPIIITEVVGHVEVRQVFEIGGGRVAGSIVKSGRAVRGARVRVRRDDDVVYEGNIASLRRFRDDVKEVQQGYECGVQLADFKEVEAGDIIEVLEERRMARRLGEKEK